MIHQRGFSLIEALIALVVLSVGLLGVAAMQLKALQSANAGYQRSVASVAAVDAYERLWATLVPGNNCDVIKVSDVQEKWRDQWLNNDVSPLRNALETQSIIDPASDDSCQFTVTLALSNDDNDILDYFFRLPNLEVLP